MVKRGEKICCFCHKSIPNNSKFVLLGTYQGKKVLDESYFHWQCFLDWHNERTKQKAKNIVNNMKNKAIDMFQKAKKGMVEENFNVKEEIPDLFGNEI